MAQGAGPDPPVDGAAGAATNAQGGWGGGWRGRATGEMRPGLPAAAGNTHPPPPHCSPPFIGFFFQEKGIKEFVFWGRGPNEVVQSSGLACKGRPAVCGRGTSR